MLLLGNAVQTQAEVKEWLDRYVDISAVLARYGTLRLSVECLMHDALTAGLIVRFYTLHALAVFSVLKSPTAIDLVKLFRQELEELMCVLFLVASQLFVRFSLGKPEARKDIGSRVAGRDLLAVKILEHVVHRTAHAILDRAL